MPGAIGLFSGEQAVTFDCQYLSTHSRGSSWPYLTTNVRFCEWDKLPEVPVMTIV